MLLPQYKELIAFSEENNKGKWVHFFGVQICAVREQTFIFLDNIIRFELVASVARGNYTTLLYLLI